MSAVNVAQLLKKEKIQILCKFRDSSVVILIENRRRRESVLVCQLSRNVVVVVRRSLVEIATKSSI